jgi:peptidoglycan/LPS O-acetylase OafA/YrhL
MDRNLNTLLSGRENNFDFMRFGAAVLVILSHAYPLTGRLEPLKEFSHGLTTLGTIAVAIFFVISGMLIAQSFERTKSFSHFVEARILRIYPALIVTIMITTFILGPILTNNSLTEYFTNGFTFKYLSNVFAVKIQYYLPGVFETNPFPNAVNGSLWTLPLELGCYALIAAALFLLRKRYLFSFILLVIAAIYLRGGLKNENILYFAFGSMLYLARHYVSMNPYIAMLSAVGFIISFMLPIQLSTKLLHCISSTYLIIYIGFIKVPLLTNFTKYGDFSYGIYIWAFPIQQTIVYFYPDLTILSHFALSTFITFCFAFASWHLVEKRALALKKRFNYKPLSLSKKQLASKI